jgi:hypothetical protein
MDSAHESRSQWNRGADDKTISLWFFGVRDAPLHEVSSCRGLLRKDREAPHTKVLVGDDDYGSSFEIVRNGIKVLKK